MFVFNLFDITGPKSTEFGRITQNNGHYAVQSRSESQILVPFESSYAAVSNSAL